MNQVGGHNSGYFFLPIQEPADLNVTWVEICHVADEQVVVMQDPLLGGGDIHFRLD